MAHPHILYEIDGPVATITLNRPDAMNAIQPECEQALHDAFDEADADPQVRSIILTGAGNAFSAGYDMSPTESGRPRVDPGTMSIGEYIGRSQRTSVKSSDKFMHMWKLSKPIIAAVNGWAMGGGFWYVLASDISVASERAVFGQPEVRQVSNSSFLLAALCGWKVANRYALTGDHMDAQEAYRLGIVNEVVPHDQLMPAARRLAERIALVPEASVRLNKAITMLGLQASGVYAGMLMNAPLSAMAHTSHGPERERLWQAKAERGMRGFLEERDGPFRPEPFGPRAAPRA